MTKPFSLGLMLLFLSSHLFADMMESCIQYQVNPEEIIRVYESSIPNRSPLENGVGHNPNDTDPILLINLNQMVNGFQKIRIIGPSTLAGGVYWVDATELQDKAKCYDDRVNWYSFDHALPRNPLLSKRVIEVLANQEKLANVSGTLLCHGNQTLKNSEPTNIYYAIYARVGHNKYKALQGRVSSAFMYLKYSGALSVKHTGEIKIPFDSTDLEYHTGDQGFETFAILDFMKNKGYLKAKITLKTTPFSDKTQYIHANNCRLLVDDDIPETLEELILREDKHFSCEGSYGKLNYQVSGSHQGNIVKSSPPPQITLYDISKNIIYRKSFNEVSRGFLSSKVFSIAPAFPEVRFLLQYDRRQDRLRGGVTIKHMLNDSLNYVAFEPSIISLPCSGG